MNNVVSFVPKTPIKKSTKQEIGKSETIYQLIDIINKPEEKSESFQNLEISFSELFKLLNKMEVLLELNLENLKEIEIDYQIKGLVQELQEKEIMDREVLRFKKRTTLLFLLLTKAEIALRGVGVNYDKKTAITSRFYKSFNRIADIINLNHSMTGGYWRRKGGFDLLTNPDFIVTSDLNNGNEYLINTACDIFIEVENDRVFNHWTSENHPSLKK